ncbi:MAG TPA: hypothetical protein VK550_06380 [Polyangiaceae bacterium]|nr:hypothetical protein [Polyangiaceae bacterium]
MPSFASRQAPCATVVLAALGCASNDAARPPPPPDCVDASCNPRPGGGGPAGGSGGSPDGGADLDAVNPPSDADGGAVTVTYTVRQTVDTWFYASASYAGAVTVRGVGPNGQLAPANDAGITEPQTVPDVAPGLNWFLLEDGTNTRRLASTLQLVDIDSRAPSANLRAITTDAITNLVIDQVLWAPPTGTATLVLNFRRAGRGAAGVTVKRDALPAGTTVAYDSSGMYVSDAMVIGVNPATDVQGTAIVREIVGTQPFPALTSATLRYALENSTTSFPAIEAKLARDTVTWMQIDLP